VDALDLCYAKGHVDTFVIISGDSDFSPLVSKLRENAKTVIGVGVKNSSSDLFIRNCDEFIYYDDLVRKSPAKKAARKQTPRKTARKKAAAGKTSEGPTTEEALEQVADTFEALLEERGNDEAIWGSMIKQALKRRNPGFNERAHGFRSFNEVLLEAEENGLLRLEADERSGGYTVHSA
ncbi:MAG: NYN domain-containing protein, partial [Verrucomicrobiota bacterium]|nr:NYN domain-containing protein [Verrucomicrobiota bacterium]